MCYPVKITPEAPAMARDSEEDQEELEDAPRKGTPSDLLLEPDSKKGVPSPEDHFEYIKRIRMLLLRRARRYGGRDPFVRSDGSGGGGGSSFGGFGGGGGGGGGGSGGG